MEELLARLTTLQDPHMEYLLLRSCFSFSKMAYSMTLRKKKAADDGGEGEWESGEGSGVTGETEGREDAREGRSHGSGGGN